MEARRASPNFAWDEFGVRAEVERRDVLEGLQRLCRTYLEPLRSQYGPVTITSGKRTPAHNRAIGGARLSHHVYARVRHQVAADVICAQGSPTDWFALLDRLGAPGLGLYRTHVHIDLGRPGRRWRA